MNKVLYFDCASGISGDMAIGAMLDLGVNPDVLKEQLDLLHVEGYTLSSEKSKRKGISGTLFTVKEESENYKHHAADHGRHHSHRHFSDIKKIIESSGLSDSVKKLSVDIFYNLALAEAKVHGTTPEKVHFHEVGAIDSIVDIVGFSICFCEIMPESVVFSALNTGSGTVRCEHGIIPVPAPATAELLIGIPCYSAHVQKELTTPTGAAIAKTVATEFGDLPKFTPVKIGYGLGQRDNDFPNVLRVFLGEFDQKKKSAC